MTKAELIKSMAHLDDDDCVIVTDTRTGCWTNIDSVTKDTDSSCISINIGEDCR